MEKVVNHDQIHRKEGKSDKSSDEKKPLKLYSPGGGEPFLFPFPPSNFSAVALDILDLIRSVVPEYPTIENVISNYCRLEDVDVNNYSMLRSLCKRFNKAVKDVLKNVDLSSTPKAAMSKDLLRHVVTRCYNKAVINEKALNKHYEAFSSQTYGETSYERMQMILDEIQPRSSDVFVDLGSGVGQLVVHVAGTACMNRAVGIEIAPLPSRFAAHLEREFKRHVDWYGKKCAPFELHQGNFLDAEYRELITQEATIIFINNYAFQSDLETRIKMELLRELKDGTRIISTKPYVSLNKAGVITDRQMNDVAVIIDVVELNRCPNPCSWTSADVPYYMHVINRAKLERYFFNRNPAFRGRSSTPSSKNSNSRESSVGVRDSKSRKKNAESGANGPTTRRRWQEYVSELDLEKRKRALATRGDDAADDANNMAIKTEAESFSEIKNEGENSDDSTPVKKKMRRSAEKKRDKSFRGRSRNKTANMSADAQEGMEILHQMTMAAASGSSPNVSAMLADITGNAAGGADAATDKTLVSDLPTTSSASPEKVSCAPSVQEPPKVFLPFPISSGSDSAAGVTQAAVESASNMLRDWQASVRTSHASDSLGLSKYPSLNTFISELRVVYENFLDSIHAASQVQSPSKLASSADPKRNYALQPTATATAIVTDSSLRVAPIDFTMLPTPPNFALENDQDVGHATPAQVACSREKAQIFTNWQKNIVSKAMKLNESIESYNNELKNFLLEWQLAKSGKSDSLHTQLNIQTDAPVPPQQPQLQTNLLPPHFEQPIADELFRQQQQLTTALAQQQLLQQSFQQQEMQQALQTTQISTTIPSTNSIFSTPSAINQLISSPLLASLNVGNFTQSPLAQGQLLQQQQQQMLSPQLQHPQKPQQPAITNNSLLQLLATVRAQNPAISPSSSLVSPSLSNPLYSNFTNDLPADQNCYAEEEATSSSASAILQSDVVQNQAAATTSSLHQQLSAWNLSNSSLSNMDETVVRKFLAALEIMRNSKTKVPSIPDTNFLDTYSLLQSLRGSTGRDPNKLLMTVCDTLSDDVQTAINKYNAENKNAEALFMASSEKESQTAMEAVIAEVASGAVKKPRSKTYSKRAARQIAEDPEKEKEMNRRIQDIVEKALQVDHVAKQTEKERRARSFEKRRDKCSASLSIATSNFAGASANYPSSANLKKRNFGDIHYSSSGNNFDLSPISTNAANSSFNGSASNSAISSPIATSQPHNFVSSATSTCAQLLSTGNNNTLNSLITSKQPISIVSVAPPPHSPPVNASLLLTIQSEASNNKKNCTNLTPAKDNVDKQPVNINSVTADFSSSSGSSSFTSALNSVNTPTSFAVDSSTNELTIDTSVCHLPRSNNSFIRPRIKKCSDEENRNLSTNTTTNTISSTSNTISSNDARKSSKPSNSSPVKPVVLSRTTQYIPLSKRTLMEDFKFSLPHISATNNDSLVRNLSTTHIIKTENKDCNDHLIEKHNSSTSPNL